LATTAPTRIGRSAEQPPAGSPLRLGPAPRRRQPAVVVLGVVLMLLCGVVFGAVMLRVAGRVPVLVVSQPVPAGHAVTEQALGEARVAADPGVGTVPAAERATVVGLVATTSLLPGTLLNRAALTPTAVPGPGQVKVGVAVGPGQLPAEPLAAGDGVAVVLAGSSGAAGAGADPDVPAPPPGTVLVERAEVYGQASAEGSDVVIVSLLVDKVDYPVVVRFGSVGQVSLVLLPKEAAG